MDANKTFSEWYAVVDPGFTGAKVTRRFSAANKLASLLSIKDAPSLVSIFYSQDPGTGFVERVRDIIREEDDTYVSYDQAELAIVAAGALSTLFTKSSIPGRACALLLLCGEFGAFNSSNRIDAVVRSADEYLYTESTRIREQPVTYPDLSDLLKPATKKIQAATKERAANEAEPEVDDCLAIDTDVLSALKTFGSALTKSLVTLEKRRLEESSVLYWLVGARALVTETAFRDFKKPRLALVAAHDLAKQTQQIPGPVSANAILLSVLALPAEQIEETTIESCVSALESEEAFRLVNGLASSDPVYMPIIFALEKAKEVDWGGGWQSAFAVRTKLRADAARPVAKVAEQFYRELLLSRLLREV